MKNLLIIVHYSYTFSCNLDCQLLSESIHNALYIFIFFVPRSSNTIAINQHHIISKSQRNQAFPIAFTMKSIIILILTIQRVLSYMTIDIPQSDEICPCVKSATGLAYNNTLLVFGGYTYNDQHQADAVFLNTIYQLDSTSLQWTKLADKQSDPSPIGVWKSGGAIISDEIMSTMYIYGGSAGKHSATDTNQFWEFNLFPSLSQWWREDNITDEHNAPYIRSHCMVSYDDMIVIFGGKGNHENDENSIRFLDTKSPENGFVEYRYDPSAEVPMARHAMTCQMMQIDDQFKLVMFGGRHQWTESGQLKVRYFNDLWTFDVETKLWSEIKHDERSIDLWPLAVAHAASTVFGTTQFMVSGGHTDSDVVPDNWMYDLRGEKWTRLPAFPNRRERCEHIAVSLGEGIMVFGGQRNLPGFDEVDGRNELLNDVLLYRLEGDGDDQWEVLQDNNC